MVNIDYSIKDVEQVIKGIDGEIKKVDISRLTTPGENYVSLVFRVDFEVEKDGQTKTVSTVAKRLPLAGIMLDFNAAAMKNEIRWYAEILPQIQGFAKEYDLDTDFYPSYLGGRFSMDPSKKEADGESVLFLENLIPEGYKNEERHIGFDLISAKSILRVLSIFHATPLAIKYKKPELFKVLKDYLESTLPPHFKKDGPLGGPPSGPPGGPPNGPPDGPSEMKLPDVKVLLRKMLDIPACQPYRANIEALMEKSSGPQAWFTVGTEPWGTVTHNDFWVNNMMVKPREGEKPLVKMVDFQMCTYSSYAKDLIFFLLSSIKNDVQKQHFDELLRYYYDQLTAIFEKLDIPELKLPYEDFLEELKRVALESETGHALFFSSVVFAEKGSVPDFLTGEGDMLEHMDQMANNINDRQKEKLAIMTELAATRGWM